MATRSADTSLLQSLAEDKRLQQLQRALGAEAELHLVGGTVRDALLGLEASDLDVATALVPDEVIARLDEQKIRYYPTGLQHQTLTVLCDPDLPPIELTTFRCAGMTPQGGLVKGSSIEEDLLYRDFTINAFAYSLADGTFLDPTNGLADLNAGLVKAVGEPNVRFAEDPLRILRMLRFACTFRFEINEATFSAAKALINELQETSVERIREELDRTLISPQPGRALRLLEEIGFLEAFLPEVAAYVDFEQNEFHRDDLFNHTIEVIENTSPDLILRLAALLHDVGKPATLSVDEEGSRHFYLHESVGAKMTVELLKRFRYSNAMIDAVSTLVHTHMRPTDAGPGGLRRILRDTGDYYPQWRELKYADSLATKLDKDELEKALEVFDEAIEVVRQGPELSPLRNLAINGDDLIALGMTPGPHFGEILRALHERVLDEPELNEKDTLLEMARKLENG